MLTPTPTPPTVYLGHLWEECPSSDQQCLQPRQGSRKKLEAHTATWNRMLRWNKRCSGCQRTTSWDQISHYLPHKTSWPEAKVRQAGRHSWVQRLRRVISVTKVTYTIRPSQLARVCSCNTKWWQTLSISLVTLPNTIVGLSYSILWLCWPHKITAWERSAIFVSPEPFYFFSLFIP